ncbi:MAG: hypothetical protein JST54_00425 [Deltaproteobacteria bacterium]|nr:hypothetical protein [Deltaproteobacteria bacterium]
MLRQGLGVAVAWVVLGSGSAVRAEDAAAKQQPVAQAAEVATKEPAPVARAAEVPAPTPREPPQVRWLFSVSGGADLLAPNGPDDARYSMAFGLHVGSRFPTGVSVTLGYDNLELRPNGNEGTPWQLIDMSARYTLKYGPVKPFGEVVGGLSFISTSEPLDPGNGPLEVDLAAGLAAGVTLPVGNTFAVDLAVRGYTAPALGRVLQAALVQLSIELDLDLAHDD